MSDTTTAPAAQPSTVDDVSELQEQRDRLAARSRALSRWRLVCFVLGAIGLAVALDAPAIGLSLTTGSVLAFGFAFACHARVLDELERDEGLLTLARERHLRQSSRRREHPAPAPAVDASPLERGLRLHAAEPAAHELDEHAADDLGLFGGPRSLFGFIDWTSTTFGSRRLRRILSRLLRDGANIEARQRAVAEIAERADTRRDILLPLLSLRRLDLSPLGGMFGQPAHFAGRRGLALLASILGTVAPLVLVALFATGQLVLIGPLVILAAINFTVIGVHARASNKIRDRLLLLAPLLDALDSLASSFAAAKLEADEWRQIKDALDGVAPAVRELRGHLGRLAFHSYGPVFELVNILVLWELRILPRAEAVFVRRRAELEAATGALAEAEALVCLALPLAEEADFTMPQLLEAAAPSITAEQLGHPLIDPEECVHNPLELGGDGGRIWILTGSNMSGKSTFLKSIGQNLVLASCGAPVCAQSFSWTPVALHTDVNVRDSLDDGKSYFQVEVERVRISLEHARRDNKTLLLCDEMFRGTNSDERLAISRAVVHYLRDSGALAVVATHDKALANLAVAGDDANFSNHHLRDLVEDGVMGFDYRLRAGISPTRNAVRVLESQGYPKDLVDEARGYLDEDRAS